MQEAFVTPSKVLESISNVRQPVSVRRAVPVPKPIPPPLPVSLERLTTPNRAGPSYNSDPVSAPRSQLERLSPLNQDLSEGHASEVATSPHNAS